MRRPGVTLLEILFSMLLVSVGLFGAIALLPVAASQSKRGRLADMQSVLGESAINEFLIRGMDNATTWIAPSNPSTMTADSFFTAAYVDTATGNRSRVPYYPDFGYCIDPLFVASPMLTYGPQGQQGHSRYFPYYLPTADTSTDVNFAIRMERISLQTQFWDKSLATPAWNTRAMSVEQALTIFASDDDQYFERSNKDTSVPATQLYVKDPTAGVSLRRMSENNLTWFATLAPRNQAGTDRAPEEFVLSIVVLNRRAITNLTVDTDFLVGGKAVAAPERVVDVATFPGAGVGGGEVELQSRPNRGAGDLDVRPGDWLMLTGSFTRPVDNPSALPNPYVSPDPPLDYALLRLGGGVPWVWNAASVGAPGPQTVTSGTPVPGVPVPQTVRPIYQWYRVVESDPDDPLPGYAAGTVKRNVTLAGADWPLAHITGNTSVTQATIVSGVVAVYEKTIRLRFK